MFLLCVSIREEKRKRKGEKLMKRFWALVLVVLMVLGMVACGTPAASTNSSATPAETPKDSSAAPAEKQNQ